MTVIDPITSGTAKLKALVVATDRPLDDLAVIANRIRARIRRTTIDIIDTGNDLIAVKAKLDHGAFVEPGEVSMLIPVPRGGLAAFERDPLVGAFLEQGATVVAEFEDADEACLFEAKVLGRLA